MRTFRSSYRTFWTRLVAEMHALGLVLDDLFVDRINALLIALSWWEGVGLGGGPGGDDKLGTVGYEMKGEEGLRVEGGIHV